MEGNCRNIYYNARRASGFTQERWAEHLGVSPEAVRQYESGKIMPSDDIVLQMAEISEQLKLPYWHLQRKSRLAGAILPELEENKGLPEAVLDLLIQIDDFKTDGLPKLMRIAADGQISDEELADYDHAVEQLQQLIRKAFDLSYAK